MILYYSYDKPLWLAQVQTTVASQLISILYTSTTSNSYTQELCSLSAKHNDFVAFKSFKLLNICHFSAAIKFTNSNFFLEQNIALL